MTNLNQTLTLGNLAVGSTLEVGVSKKGGIETQANYYRLTSEQKQLPVGGYLITSSKDKVDFCVAVPELTDNKLIDFLSDAINGDDSLSNKTLQFIKDNFYAVYKELANEAFNNQSSVIKLELADCIEFATALRTRVRKSVSFTGEYYKAVEAALLPVVIDFMTSRKAGVSPDLAMVKKFMAMFKGYLTIEQMTNPVMDKVVEFIISNNSAKLLPELVNNLQTILEMKIELAVSLEDF